MGNCIRPLLAGLWLCAAGTALAFSLEAPGSPQRFPADKATGVNPDAHLVLTFPAPPVLGSSGQIRVFDADTHALTDTLDLSVPPAQQSTVIGRFTEGFHFYPVIVHGTTATIYPHQHRLSYGRRYYVEIDSSVLTADGFAGFTGESAWTFSTKAAPPSGGATRLVVSMDGRGDFDTVQGAVDFVPDQSARRTTIAIRPGTYEEIVYFRHKSNITFRGDDRGRVVIGYANNERFNGPPAGVPTNEKPDTFPYRRASFSADRSTGIHIENLSLKNFTPSGGGQAEALLISGGQNIVSRVSLYGHQDTIQLNDSVLVEDSYIEGETDFLWGRGPAFFRHSVLRQLTSTSPFMWVRSTSASHGFVFVNCRFETPDQPGPGPLLARNTAGYPDSEVVLIDSAIGAINPAAWGLAGDTANQHYWEFHSTNIKDGRPADTSRRHPASKQLTMERDAGTIRNYRNPAYVLGGWTPGGSR